MRRARRRWVRLLLAFGLAAALLIGLLAAGLFPQEPLRRFVERRLREALGPATRLDHLHVVPGTLSVDIRGLVLEGPTYRLELPRARAEATLDLLLSRRLSFDRLEAHGARLTLRAPDTPSPTASQPLPEVRIGELRLSDSEIRYQDPALGGEVVLRGVEADGAIGTGLLDLRVERATWDRPAPLVITPVRARVELSPDLRLRLESLEAATATSRLYAEGEVGTLQAPELDVRVRLTLDLAEAATLAGSTATSKVASTRGAP